MRIGDLVSRSPLLRQFLSVSPADSGPQNRTGASFFGRPATRPRDQTLPTRGVGTDPKTAQRMTLAAARDNSNFFRERLGLFKALIEGTSRYTLGLGLAPTSLCEDPDWAPRADDFFHDIASSKKLDLRGELNFPQMQKVILPDVITDGDAGAAPVIHPDGRRCVQLFPADSICNCTGPSPLPEGRWEDGIFRSIYGEPLAYRIVSKRLSGYAIAAGYTDFPAEQFWHIGKTGRINQGRPYPWLAHGAEAGINIIDSRALEMASRKLNSYLVAAVTARNGELPPSLDDLRNMSEGIDVSDGTETENVETTVDRAERRIVDLYGAAGIIPLDDGEKIEFFKNDRQSMTVTAFLDYLIADIAIGFGVPTQFVWALTGLAGPQSRMILQQADWFFNDVADMLVTDFCQPLWEAVIQDAMGRGILPAPKAGTNWRRVHWQGPGSLTIDKGRDAKMYIEQIKHGTMRRSVFSQMTGGSGLKDCYKTIDEIAMLLQYCEQKQVPPSLFFGKDFQGVAAGSIDPEEISDRLAERMREEREEEAAA